MAAVAAAVLVVAVMMMMMMMMMEMTMTGRSTSRLGCCSRSRLLPISDTLPTVCVFDPSASSTIL